MRLQRGSGLGGSSPSVRVLEQGMSMPSGLQRWFSNAREQQDLSEQPALPPQWVSCWS